MNIRHFNRRDFIKLGAVSFGALAFEPWTRRLFRIPEFPQSERLGRLCVGKVELKARPDYNSENVGILYEDNVVPCISETVGYWPGRNNQRFMETPGGYVWSAYLQPVENSPNAPLESLTTDNGPTGMWVEVSIPWVDAILINPPARSPALKWRIEVENKPKRFFYSEVVWVDQIRKDDDGQIWYRVNERYGNRGDLFWVPGEALRPINGDELTPISPDVEDKRIVIDASWHRQTLSCYEGNTEVYFCRISTGVATDSTPATPPGGIGYPIWRKLYSLHMSGGTNIDGWDLSGIGWTQLFIGDGVAIHSTYWHNNFGEPMSRGCVNATPEDSKWIFRWTKPTVSYEPGEVTIVGAGSTRITVIEG
jgi:lipoprotein-anchoring transpeptidase ErfK/SrfK